MPTQVITRSIRSALSSPGDRYASVPGDGSDLKLDSEQPAGLYIHIPFCLSMCPYCPYNRIRYEPALAERYCDALLLEIARYGELLGGRRFESLYIGGGTPTLVTNRLPELLAAVRNRFVLEGPVAIETTPSDTNNEKLAALRDCGVDFVSLGVQSFTDANLGLIGRNYRAEEAVRALDAVMGHGFPLCNVDMIFAFPGQRLAGLREDIAEIKRRCPNQVTWYPLFTFPHSAVGRARRLLRVRMPSVLTRRRMYYEIHERFQKDGFERTSVWSFNRSPGSRYSSVTRDYYVGFGAGAGSFTGTGFYFNTFSVPDYIAAVKRRLPVALRMGVTERMRRLFWFYWRPYETVVPARAYEERFGAGLQQDFGAVLNLMQWLGLARVEPGRNLRLTRQGAHWVHLAQNYFALNYVAQVWSHCQAAAWPGPVRL